jgi:hypothetical protein
MAPPSHPTTVSRLESLGQSQHVLLLPSAELPLGQGGQSTPGVQQTAKPSPAPGAESQHARPRCGQEQHRPAVVYWQQVATPEQPVPGGQAQVGSRSLQTQWRLPEMSQHLSPRGHAGPQTWTSSVPLVSVQQVCSGVQVDLHWPVAELQAVHSRQTRSTQAPSWQVWQGGHGSHLPVWPLQC